VLATMPKGVGRQRGEQVSELIRTEAPRHGLLVADVEVTTASALDGRYAADGFHPSERGYEAWTRAFAAPVNV